MSISDKYLAPLLPEHFYHIYNRTNNKEKLFREDKNRIFFLSRYRKYLYPVVKTYGYSLLDNHFHFIISVRSQNNIIDLLKGFESRTLTLKERQLLQNPGEDLYINHFIEWQFLRFFTSYSMSFNRLYARKGNLFHRPFKRVEIEDEHQLSQVVSYVHCNPVKHGVVANLADYKWSSYNSFLSDKPSLLERDYIIKWFGNEEMFIKSHQKQNEDYQQYSFYIEE